MTTSNPLTRSHLGSHGSVLRAAFRVQLTLQLCESL